MRHSRAMFAGIWGEIAVNSNPQHSITSMWKLQRVTDIEGIGNYSTMLHLWGHMEGATMYRFTQTKWEKNKIIYLRMSTLCTKDIKGLTMIFDPPIHRINKHIVTETEC